MGVRRKRYRASAAFRGLPTPLKGRLTVVMIYATRLSDGKKVRVRHEDRGALVPAFDRDGNPFDAYTSHFEFPDGEDTEFFNQIDKRTLPRGVDVGAWRASEDDKALSALGYRFTDADIDFDA